MKRQRKEAIQKKRWPAEIISVATENQDCERQVGLNTNKVRGFKLRYFVYGRGILNTNKVRGFKLRYFVYGRGKILSLEGGLEPPTLWLTATRSNQLSYSSF